MRLAIVDDIVSERKELHNRLSVILYRCSHDDEIFEYADGETFLSAAEKERFEIVFLDIYMNGANGIEIAKSCEPLTKNVLSFHNLINRLCA